MPRALAGPQGPQGLQGPAGPRGFSAWDKIPSGVTVTGNFWIDTFGPIPEADTMVITIDLPGIAPQPLTADQVEFGGPFGPSTDENPACTGSNFNVTAPPGMVCIYIAGYNSGVTDIVGNPAQLGTRGFTIAVSGAVDSDPQVSGKWAYTAP